MSFFPRGFTEEPVSFHPLFRLLDDFDNYNRAVGPQRGRGNGHHKQPTWNPKFDVKELTDGYELYGEIPGIDQKDVEIEFSDPQTLTVRGRTVRSYTAGTPPSAAGFAAVEEEGGSETKSVTDGAETHNNYYNINNNSSHKATVEDEDAAEANKENTTVSTQRSASQQQQQQQEQQQPTEKYWVSERSVGEFSRAFSFPTRVDQDAVTASMKNGILSIVVPKAKKAESRRIAISS